MKKLHNFSNNKFNQSQLPTEQLKSVKGGKNNKIKRDKGCPPPNVDM